MPGGDGTGPNGEGPMTGRGMGFCAGFNVPGYANPGFGGRWIRRGRGFAFRRIFFPQIIQPQITKKQEKEILENELQRLKEEIQEIEKRLKELKD